MSDIQQELAACRESAETGYQLAQESFDKLKDALAEEREKLREADRRQQSSRLENDRIFRQQLREMDRLENETVSRVEDNLRTLKKKMADFTIVLYGRTMAGKSTLMEILRHGDGSSIGKGAQRTTRDVRAYTWEGLKIFDVPGTCSFGGAGDDKIAFEAAKDADIALFLLTDDAPQPSEAQRLAELKKLGKPVLGIVNVKQVLNPDCNSSQRRINVLQLRKKLDDKERLAEIVRQFKEFSQKNGYNFEDVPFVYSHLQSAFFSQRENDAALYEISNFAEVEEFILNKVRSSGKIIRIKTFVDAAARPIQDSIEKLYRHSSDSVRSAVTYGEKREELDRWWDNYLEESKARLGNFIENITGQLNAKINYVVDNYYDSSRAGEYWQQAIDELNLDRQCQRFIEGIGEDVTDKLHDLSDELTQDLRYAGISMDIPAISMESITDYRSAIMTIGAFLGPVGWAVGIGAWLFGKSKSEKIAEAKKKLREALIPSRDDIIEKTFKQIVETLDSEIGRKQIRGFYRSLGSRIDALKNLAYAQQDVASNVSMNYYQLNLDFLVQAVVYCNIDPRGKLVHIDIARIVGDEIFIVSEAHVGLLNLKFLEAIIGEKITAIKVSEEKHFLEMAKQLIEKYLEGNFETTELVVDEGNDKSMRVMFLPKNFNSKEYSKNLLFEYQLLGMPVIFI